MRRAAAYWREALWLFLLAVLSLDGSDGWWNLLNPVSAAMFAVLYYYSRRDREERQK